MGIAPYKYFTYDGESSRDYDVYLTGDGVFNAPERAVEMLEIPGRNGNYALDQGKFNNISVTYKAGIVDYSESDFADKVSAVRNWLCSKVGYKRLSDDYNPNEYRMAVYRSGVEIDHVDLKTGEFEITFDCKPQRWLTSGETAVTVANNGTLSNPTNFEAEPLLAVSGYGTIGFNGYEVEIENVPIGDIMLYSGGSSSSITLNESSLNVGDTITVNVNSMGFKITASQQQSGQIIDWDVGGHYITDSNPNFVTTLYSEVGGETLTAIYYTTAPSFNIVVGTSSSITNTVSGYATLDVSNIGYVEVTLNIVETLSYDAATHTLKAQYSFTVTPDDVRIIINNVGYAANYDSIIGHSTKSAAGDTAYIDCDIGECWTVQGGSIISLNHLITLGSDLPKLASGSNTFTYDNTVTELKVTPRWWKV